MGFFNKIFLKKNKQTQEEKLERINNKISQKVDDLTGFFQKKFEQIKSEYAVIRKKLSNLLATNYDLGLWHIEQGNISEAIFRFRFIKKFWPNCYDAYYQLAYCLILAKRPFEAKKILKELVEKNPDYNSAANHLLEQINKIT